MANIQKDAYERLAWEPGFIPFRFNCGKMSGGPYQAVTWGRERENAGVTDLAVLAYGLVMVWFEVKQDKEEHRPSQKYFASVIQEHGGLIFTIRTLEELEIAIQEIRTRFG